ncbi:MAG: TonB-dependent receptor [Chitinophagales bacterium]
MRLLFTYLLVLTGIIVRANTVADSIALPEVIKVDRIQKEGKTSLTDLQYKSGKRLSEALSEFSSVYIKNYGNGQLASLAIRGTSASQTEIQWNGIRLNNPSLGQTDLSLFLVGVFNRVNLIAGGYRGTIGGTLQMSSEAVPDTGVSLDLLLRVGSFGKLEGNGQLKYSNGRFSGSSCFTYGSSKNDFTYRNTFLEGHPIVKETNGAVKQYSFLQDFNAAINHKNNIGVSLWLTGAQRQLPPIMSKPESKEKQDDNSIRLMAYWRGNYKRLRLSQTSAFLQDEIHYVSPEAHIDSKSQMQAYRNVFNAQYTTAFNLALQGEVTYDHERARVANYGGIKSRNIAGLRLYADYYWKNLVKFHAGFRQDVLGKRLSPFAPEIAINVQKQLKQHVVSAGVNASRNFRFPTLNDLYWITGGNPELRTEKSWNGEVSMKYAYKSFVSLSVNAYAIYVRDWIQWVSAGTEWHPENFKRVFSRGVEVSLDAATPASGKVTFRLHTAYSFTKATNLDNQGRYDQTQGKQLIYVPLHNVSMAAELQYRRFYLRLYNTYTGSVFITTDNSQRLKGYCLVSAEIGKDIKFGSNEIGLSFRVNNILNTAYQNVAQRPMPGRSFEGALRFNLTRK